MSDYILSENKLEALMKIIHDNLGLHFPREKWSGIEKALLDVNSELGYKNIESLANKIIHNEITKPEIETLAAALTVGETYFFREPNALKAFEYFVLPDLIKKAEVHGRRLRIWSAGCATGEEPYTIAMILKNSIPSIEDWDITILATDINVNFIRKAIEGVYTRWSFRDVPAWIINKFFIKKSENLFELKDEIRSMVNFNYLNLMEDIYPSILNNTNAMDIIFCRNVLMYFSEENIRKVTRKIHNSLNDDGTFIVSQTELSEYYYTAFKSVSSSGAIIYKKYSYIKPGIDFTEIPYGKSLNEYKSSSGGTHPPENTLLKDLSVNENKRGEIDQNSINQNRIYHDDMNHIRKLYQSGEYDDAIKKLTFLVSAGKVNPEALALLARVYADKGMLELAEKYCREAVAADSMNSSFQFLLASIFKESGRTGEAVSTLRKAIYLNHDYIMAYYTLGIIAVGQKNQREAKKNLDTALSLIRKYDTDQFIPESEGIPAGRLAEIIESIKLRV